MPYRDAGAEVVYAPGLIMENDIARVVAESATAMSGVALPGTPPVARLAKLGVRRISTGAALFNAAYRAVRDAAAPLLDR